MSKMMRRETEDGRFARGMDTQAMIPVAAAFFEIVSMLFLPWVSMPELKYSPYPDTSTLCRLSGFYEGLTWGYPVPERLVRVGTRMAVRLEAAMWIGVSLCVIFLLAAYRFRVKAVWLGRITFLYNAFLSLVVFAWAMDTNMMLDLLEGKCNSFWNLTINSHVQLSAYAYVQILLGIVMLFALRPLLDTRKEYGAEYYITRYEQEDQGIGRRTILASALILAAIPAVIFFGIFFLNNRSEYFISLCVIVLSMLPFFLVFENRRPQAREVVVIAVMAALAAAGRVAFFMLPHFNPTAAIVIIAGISLGAEAGFLTGALAGFVSNFFFGQGPWTPWQMFSFGIIGFLAGLIFRRKRGRWKHFKVWLCLYGGLSVLVIYGILMDTSSVSLGTGKLEVASFLAVYASGFPLNLVHGGSTVIFLGVLGEPMMKKLDRIKKKYGLLEP